MFALQTEKTDEAKDFKEEAKEPKSENMENELIISRKPRSLSQR